MDGKEFCKFHGNFADNSIAERGIIRILLVCSVGA